MWTCARQDCDFACRLYANGRALPTASRHSLRWAKRADFNVSGNAYAEDAPFIARTPLLFTKLSVVNHPLRFIKSRFVVTAVVEKTCCSMKGKLFWLRKISSTHFSRINSKFCRNQIHRALYNVSRFGAASAPVCVRCHLVSENARDVYLYRGNFIAARKHQPRERRNSWREQLMISP